MSQRPTAVPGARATLILSLVMSLVGGTGLLKSCALLRTHPGDLERAESGSPPEAESAMLEANERLVAAMVTSRAMRATFIFNLIASALLVLAAFFLVSRRESALWWTRQALAANAVHAIGFVVGSAYFARRNEALLAELAQRLAANQGQETAAGSPALGFLTGAMCSSALMLGVYAVMLRTVRRKDVQAFLRRQAR